MVNKLSKIKVFGFVSLGLLSLFIISAPLPANAACSPAISISASPLTVTTKKPNSNFSIKLGNLSVCTQAELNELSFYIEPGTASIGKFHETIIGSFVGAGQASAEVNGLALNVVQPNSDYAAFTQRNVPYVAHVAKGSTNIATSQSVVFTISDNKAAPPSANTNSPTNSNANKGTPRPNTNTGVIANIDYDKPIGEFNNPLTLGTVPEIIARVIRILLALVGMLSIVVIILAGFRMVAQGDNPAAVTKARKAITWAILGLLTALLSFSIVSIIQRIIQR